MHESHPSLDRALEGRTLRHTHRGAPYAALGPLAIAALLCLLIALGPGAAPRTAEEEIRQLIEVGHREEAEARARELLRTVEASHGPHSLETARTLDLLMDVLELEWKTHESELRGLARRAIRIREEALGPHHPEVAHSLTCLGALLLTATEYEKAIELYERALSILENAFGADHPEVAECLEELSLIHREIGDYSAALEFSERALGIKREILGSNHPLVAECLRHQANLVADMGDYARARPLYESALVILEENPEATPLDLSWALECFASLLHRTGDFAAAKPLYERSLRIREETLGPDHIHVARTLNYLGDLLRRMEEPHRARQCFERGLGIAERVLGSDHPFLAWGLNDLGKLTSEMGDHAGARALYERARAVQEGALGPDDPLVAETVDNLAGVFCALGDYQRALSYYERALAAEERARGPDHPLVARSEIGLSSVLARTGARDQALRHALKGEAIAREHFRLTARTLARREALRYASIRTSGLDVALSLVADIGRAASSGAEVWDALIRSRALVLDEMAARRRGAVSASDPEIRRREEALLRACERLAYLTMRDLRRQSGETYRGLRDQARREKERAERELAAVSVAFRDDQEVGRVGLTEVALALPGKSALVAFTLYRHQETDVTPRYAAFFMRGDEKEPLVFPLGSAAEIDTLVSRWKSEAARETPGPRRQRAVSDYLAAAEALRTRVWDPFAGHLEGCDRLFLVPDGSLNLVSFAALPDTRGFYLAESGMLIHYLSTERDLARAPSALPAGEGLLVLGNPDFDALLTPATIPRLSGPARARGELLSLRFAPLPGAAREAEEVASLWRDHCPMRERSAPRAGSPEDEPFPVVCLTGESATEKAFKEGAPGRAVLHLATHGFFLAGRCGPAAGAEEASLPAATSPLLLSGLALSGANERDAAGSEGEDGILTAEEIAALRLAGVSWAVLSGCDTGVGEVTAGEGVLGLRRAFHVAGAGAVIMSLWPVSDEATRQWMRALYESRLGRGLATAEAVHEANLSVLRDRREKGRSTHPFYWAGFVAEGDWR